jgi:hypothetical protein
MPQKIRIIGVPMDLGQSRRGVDMGPSALRVAGLQARLKQLGHQVEDIGNIAVKQAEEQHYGEKRAKYLNEIAETCRGLAEIVERALGEGFLPLMLGGDHSIAVGSLAGVASYSCKQSKRVGCLWLDAHGDMNTPESSPSGNVHGMPMAAVIGYGAPELKLFERAIAAWLRRQAGSARRGDPFWLALADRLLFSAIRRPLGRNLKALICGSAPLAKETQLFFMMLGIPVLQVYGLTETTAICTMDHPERIEVGRVGPAIPGVEMRLGEKSEILVRGPNISPGYWNRPEETAKVLRNGWFHTGDQGEVSDAGNWSIVGRLKNLIVLDSGHNVAPEPLEETLLRRLPSAQQVVVMGNGRSFLSAVVTGGVAPEEVETALESVNGQLPHYKRIRAFHVETQPFTIESGLLTANGKLKRDAIAARFGAQMDALRRRGVSIGEAP